MISPETTLLEARDQLLTGHVQAAWEELSHAISAPGRDPEFSGILPLRGPTLLPFLEQPGVFLVMGPTPELPILHVGAAQGPMGRNLWARLVPSSRGGFVWRWEEESDPAPTYAACVAFDRGWGLIPSMKALLIQRLGDELPTRRLDPGAAPFL